LADSWQTERKAEEQQPADRLRRQALQEPIRILGKGRAGRLAPFLFLIGLMADEEDSSTMQGLWRN
jgi:hypothetical protein